MNRRIGATSVFALAFILGGCAAGSSGGAGAAASAAAAAPQEFTEENLPAWAAALPEGTPPRENEHTEAAALAFFYADNAAGDVRMARIQEALAAAQAGIALDPGNAQSYLDAGRAHVELDNFQEADQNFDRAEEIYPRFALESDFFRERAWIEAYNASIQFIQTDDPDQALPLLERADLIYQWRPEAKMQLGQIYADRDRLDEAIDAFTSAAAATASERARALRDPEILAQWDRFREIALYNSAELMYSAMRFAEAASVYEVIVAEYPEDLDAAVNLGVALVEAGDVQRATQSFEDLMARPGLSPIDLSRIGAGLELVEQPELAAQAFGRAHEMMPMDFESLFFQVQALYFAGEEFRTEGDTAQANALFRQVIDLGDDLLALDTHGRNSHTYYLNANIHAVQGEAGTEAANEIYERLEALPFEVEGTNIAATGDGYAVAGQVVNNDLAAGSTVQLRITFYDSTGAAVGTQNASVPLGQMNEASAFQVNINTSAEVMGYRYEVL